MQPHCSLISPPSGYICMALGFRKEAENRQNNKAIKHRWQRQYPSDFADRWANVRYKSEQPSKVIADKVYDVDWLLHYLDSENIEAVKPPKKSQLEQNPIDYKAYKERNVIERTINKLKQYRRIATRYVKTATSFQASYCFVTTFVNLSL